MSNGFFNQLSKGKKVEQAVKEYLENERKIKVTDYSDNKEWRKVDIDFAIEDKDGNKATLEVKMDAHLNITPNVYIESYSITKSGKNEGFLEKCKADYIAYYNPDIEQGIIVEWEGLKAAVAQYCEKKTRYDAIDDKQREYYLFPMKKAEELNLIAHKWSK